MIPPYVGFLLVFSFVLFPVAVLLAMFFYLRKQPRRRAEDEVKRSDLILKEDIDMLTRTKSRLLDDAAALRRAQTEQERNYGN